MNYIDWENWEDWDRTYKIDCNWVTWCGHCKKRTKTKNFLKHLSTKTHQENIKTFEEKTNNRRKKILDQILKNKNSK